MRTIKTLRRIPHPKKQQRQMEEFVALLVNQSVIRFINGVAGQLTANLLPQANDRKTKSYVANIETLSRAASSKIVKQFPDKRISQKVEQLFTSADDYNKKLVYTDLADKFEVSKKALLASDTMNANVKDLSRGTAAWIKTLRSDTTQTLTNNAIRVASMGGTLSDIKQEMISNNKTLINKSKYLASTQVASFNAISTKIRHQKLGIIDALWHTNLDGRERPCHRARDNKRFTLTKGLYSKCDGRAILPGVEHNCRCSHTAILPDNFNILK